MLADDEAVSAECPPRIDSDQRDMLDRAGPAPTIRAI